LNARGTSATLAEPEESRVSQGGESIEQEVARLRVETARLTALLAGSDDVLRRSFAAAPIGMAIIGADPPRYLELNQAFADFLGRSTAEILATDPYVFWAEVTHPDDFIEEQTFLARLVAGEIDRYELRKRFLRPNGEIRWGLLAFSAVRRPDGSLQFGIGQIADVHDRVLLEEQTHRSQKLEAIGQLAGGIAHDFNNLLTVVMGYADLLMDELPTEDPRWDYANQMLEGATQGADLTRQLLAYGRRQVLLPKVFSASPAVAVVCDLVGRLLNEQIEFSRRLDAVGHIEADPAQVEQVVMNLVLNGRDALKKGGHLSVETDDVDGAESLTGPCVRIRVTDDGEGMTEDVRAHIFEPFFTTKPVGSGTGLGLSTVWGIVQQSHGLISVASRPGAGSRFDVYFRRVEPRPEPAQVRNQSPRSSRHATILLAEDNAAVRRLLTGVLRGAGYTVAAAETADAAHEISASTPIDLVISDMVMPRRSGLSLLQELRRDHPHLPALIVSGYSDEAALLAESISEAHYLFKPFVPGVLIDRVREILG
jgi:two-component system cell cycle sensor histidine kinase/response regulator CckA